MATNNILFNDYSLDPGSRDQWSATPLHNANFTSASFASILTGFKPIAANPTALTNGSVNNSNATIWLADASWNVLKDIDIDYTGAATVSLKNFVHTDITTNIDTDGASNITIDNVKRGQVTTGNGNDKVDVDFHSNSDWSNQFEITTGAGNDTILAGGGTLNNATFNPSGLHYNGELSQLFVAAGNGDNLVVLNGGGNTLARNGAGNYGAETFVKSGNGNDHIIGGTGVDVISSGKGEDSLAGGNGDDIIFAGTGNDVVRGDLYQPDDQGTGADILVGGGGCDRIGGKGGDDLIFGDEYIVNSQLAETLSGPALATLAAKEAIAREGFANHEVTVNGPGEVFSFGSSQFFNADVADISNGRIGDDTLSGESGNDTIFGGGGDDIVYGVQGNDLLFGDGGEKWGRDTVQGGEGNDTIYGGKGKDVLAGESGNDVIYGGDGADTINGGSDTGTINTTVYSAITINDSVDGGGSFFTFSGGDTLTGGSGHDVYILNKNSNVDNVTDFSHGVDLVNVSNFSLAQTFGLGTDSVLFDNGAAKAVLHATDGYHFEASDFAFV